jgi:PST family polysaccharide transporter
MSTPGLGYRAGGQVLVAQVARFAIQGAALLLLARLLEPADFGLVAMVLGIVGIASVIGDAGLSLAAVQADQLSAGQKNTLFWLNTGLGLLLGIVVFVAADAIAAFYARPELAVVTRIMAVTFPLAGLAAQFRAHLNRDLRFTVLIVADVVPQIVGLALAITLAVLDWGHWALVWQQVVASAATLAVLAVAARWMPGLPSDWANSRGLVRFGVGTSIVQVANFVSVNAPSILLGRVWGPVDAGFFSRAYALFALPMTQLAAPLTRVALPLYSRKNSVAHLGASLVRAQRLVAMGLVGIFALGAALAGPVVDLVLGPQWEQATTAFQLLALGGVFQALAYVYYWAFLATARTRLQVVYMVPLRGLTVALIAAGVAWGAAGAAAGLSLGLFVVWVVVATAASRAMGLPTRELLGTALRGLLVWIPAGAAVWALDSLVWTNLPAFARIGLGLASAALLLTILTLAVPFVRREFDFLREVLRVMVRRREEGVAASE